ncbi:MAG: YbbC/YhhH family protein [Bacteroidales bacterium]|nr:YbbC/YhhH family protein [Bacteroidales bacterium]MCM1148127.1 YbbC/YhhH family protein [Bacteroidales bacterium]MCM1206543.1 YbbC/YhhH family protein [Bacillota bacterium]
MILAILSYNELGVSVTSQVIIYAPAVDTKRVVYDDVFYSVKTDLTAYDSIKSAEEPWVYSKDAKALRTDSGWVATSGTAAQIAEAVWLSMKGADYGQYRITSSTLIDNRRWIVTAEGSGRRSLYIEIDKMDGTILRSIEN